MSDVLTKNKPQSFEDFVGNKGPIKQLCDVLKGPPSSVLLIGPSGCGKTTFCNLMTCKFSASIDFLTVNGDETDDSKKLKALIDNFASNRTIESFLCAKKHKGIVFDDIDIMFTTDKTLESFLEGIVNAKKVFVVMTCSISEEKRMTDLKKKVTCIRLSNPPPHDTFAYLSDVFDKEGIDYDALQLLNLVNMHSGSIRKTVLNLHDIGMDEKAMKVEKRLKSLMDANVFDLTQQVLSKPMTCAEIAMISETTLVPYMVHQNFLDELFKNKLKSKKTDYHEIIYNTLTCFIQGEIMEQFMYANADWSLYSNVTITRCGYINNALNALPNRKAHSVDKMVFTQMLTKSALRCNYQKKLRHIKQALHICETDDVLYVFDCILQEMYDKGKSTKKFKQALQEKLGFDNQDLSTMFQYFSQFINIDKSVLNKFKK